MSKKDLESLYFQKYYDKNKYRGLPSLKELVEIIQSNNTWHPEEPQHSYMRKKRLSHSDLQKIQEEIENERHQAKVKGFISHTEYDQGWRFSKKSRKSRKSVRASKKSKKSRKSRK